MTKFSSAMDRDANRMAILSNEAFKSESTRTFVAATTGALGFHNLFTVTGDVMAKMIYKVSTSLTSGDLATLSVGTADELNGFSTVTWAVADLVEGAVFIGSNASAGGSSFVRATPMEHFVGSGADIGYNIADFTIIGGVIKFYCLWRPLSSDANMTVATPA